MNDGRPVRAASASVPSFGVFFTVNALFARWGTYPRPARPSSNVISSFVLFTVAEEKDGAVSSMVTVMSKLSLTVPPAPSLTVTFTVTVPASAAAGVPEK